MYYQALVIFGLSFSIQSQLSNDSAMAFLSRVSMPMHAESDIVMAKLSVCHMLELYQNECTHHQNLRTVWEGHD